MTHYFVDTDWLIDVLNDQEGAQRSLETLAPNGLAVSHVSYAELYEGVYYARDPDAALVAMRAILKRKDLLPITEAILQRFAIVRGGLTRHLRRQIGDLDLLIAATALDHDLTLVTRNLRDFQHVPGLRLYQPN